MSCRQCKAIVKTGKKPILGVGSPEAKIIVVGLAPGKDGADRTGIPFTRDPSGELFDEVLSAAGLSRSQDVFITNLVKCNPKDAKGRNRTPSKSEMKNCYPYLRREIDYVKPRIIVTLGKAATEFLLGTRITKMAQIHGKIKRKKGISFFPFIHPGYVIRGAYDRKKFLDEFKILGDVYRNLIKQESRLSRLDILLLLLEKGSDSIPIGAIRGKTRLQKLLFLLQHELKKRGYKARYAFRPYLYGPYSRELYTDVEWLRMSGLVEVRTTFDKNVGQITDFAVTEKGRRRLIDMMNSQLHKSLDEVVEIVITKYGKMGVAQLVEFVHEKFSNYDQSRLQENKKRIEINLDDFVDKAENLNNRNRLLKKEI